MGPSLGMIQNVQLAHCSTAISATVPDTALIDRQSQTGIVQSSVVFRL